MTSEDLQHMFDVDREPTITTSVTVQTPDGETVVSETIKTTYRVIPNSEALGYDLASPGGTDAFLKRVVIALDDLTDKSGQPVVYSEALRDRLFDQAHVRRALAAGYFLAISEARAGN
jgi:hypothetical protein